VQRVASRLGGTVQFDAASAGAPVSRVRMSWPLQRP
jgi:hypothetical protein